MRYDARKWEGAHWNHWVLPALAFGVALSSACSSALAKRGTDIEGLRIGMSRAEFEEKLGAPQATTPLANGWVEARYSIRVPDVKRAETHGAASALTLGLWEFVAVPYELLRGPTALLILYGPGDHALASKGPRGSRLEQLPAARRVLTQATLRKVDGGRCPRLRPCIDEYEADIRRLNAWMGNTLSPADELVLRMARQTADEGDTGVIPRDAAVNRLLLIDAQYR